MNVYYLGPIGTFSYKLAKKCYPNDKIIPTSSFTEIFSHLKKDENATGVIPVENSISSNVHENIDFLFSGNYQIKKETYLKISLNLYSADNTNISELKEVYSHPKALEQCSDFIQSNALKAHPVDSTAKALKLIIAKKDNTLGAIGNFVDRENLFEIKKNIGNEEFNLTRFLHISKKKISNFTEIKGSKLSAIFKLPHIEGALSKVLTEIANLKINLSKIESKPIAGSKFEYLFWIDLEMSNDEVFYKLLKVLKKTTKDMQIVGRYNLGEILN